jgi:hypothetical protein
MGSPGRTPRADSPLPTSPGGLGIAFRTLRRGRRLAQPARRYRETAANLAARSGMYEVAVELSGAVAVCGSGAQGSAGSRHDWAGLTGKGNDLRGFRTGTNIVC